MVQQVGAELGVSYLNGLVNDGTNNHLGSTNPDNVAHNTNFRNPAGVVFGKLSYNPVSLSAQYQQAFKENHTNYKPKAWDVTGKVNFGLMGRSNWLALNYSESKVHSSNKIDQFLVGWNMALTNSISATLEYGHQHDDNLFNSSLRTILSYG